MLAPSVEAAIGSVAAPVATPAGRALLLTELFPPAVGGSAVLFQGIYTRLEQTNVTVLTDGAHGRLSSRASGSVRDIVRCPLATRAWGVLDPEGLRHHLRVAWQVRRLLPRRDGIVHCARALPEGVAALAARMIGGAPYVVWAHGEDLASALGSREHTLLTKLVLRGALAALANSHNTAALLTTFGVPESKIHVVHPAVDADRFHPRIDGSRVRQRYARPDQILLLSVGRLQRRKGHDVAIEAMARLRDELPQLRYVIVGDGEERSRLERLIVNHGLGERAFIAGTVADEELSAYYAACDIFLLPNRVDAGDIEGFGIVFLEAAATGKPAIGGNSGGVPEAVEHNATGLLVDGSVEQVAAAIRHLTLSRETRRRMGLAGRVRATQCFSWQRAAAAVSALQLRTMMER